MTLRITFRAKIYVNIYIEPRNEVKILKKWFLGISIFTQKLTQPHMGEEEKIFTNIGFIAFKRTGLYLVLVPGCLLDQIQRIDTTTHKK